MQVARNPRASSGFVGSRLLVLLASTRRGSGGLEFRRISPVPPLVGLLLLLFGVVVGLGGAPPPGESGQGGGGASYCKIGLTSKSSFH